MNFTAKSCFSDVRGHFVDTPTTNYGHYIILINVEWGAWSVPEFLLTWTIKPNEIRCIVHALMWCCVYSDIKEKFAFCFRVYKKTCQLQLPKITLRRLGNEGTPPQKKKFLCIFTSFRSWKNLKKMSMEMYVGPPHLYGNSIVFFLISS